MIKIYNQETEKVEKGEVVARNPLIKNKGKIMDDWSMPDEILGHSSNEILEKSGHPIFSALLGSNDRNFHFKTKSQKEKLNYSSFKADKGSIGSSQLVD